MSVEITEYKPGQPLDSFVEFFWTGEFNTTYQPRLSQLVVPNGYVELIIHITDQHCDLQSGSNWGQSPDYTIIGLYTRPYEVQFRSYVRTFGIRFKPEGIYNIFGIPASLFTEQFKDMELVLGSHFRDYCSRLRESEDTSQKLALTHQYLLNQLQNHYPEKTYLNRAADLIRVENFTSKVDELPGKVYISRRQLEREFKEKIGLSPKQYIRLARLNAINRYLQSGREINLGSLSLEAGFADQAHLCREFKTFAGLPPAKFMESVERFIVNV
jgi:AraC-like DNA-binding protein